MNPVITTVTPASRSGRRAAAWSLVRSRCGRACPWRSSVAITRSAHAWTAGVPRARSVAAISTLIRLLAGRHDRVGGRRVARGRGGDLVEPFVEGGMELVEHGLRREPLPLVGHAGKHLAVFRPHLLNRQNSIRAVAGGSGGAWRRAGDS
jgi:hypothetical protein